MLFIYGALPIGGIETFFMRMAKERARLGLPTIVLLLAKPEMSDSELLAEMKKYAQVIFQDDIFINFFDFTRRLPLINLIKKKSVIKLLNGIEQIHTFDGMHALVGHRLAKVIGKNLPITIGFYHYIKYLWGRDDIAYFERINRKFVFNYLPKECLLFFSEGTRQLYTKHKQIDFTKSNIFRLGVVDKKEVHPAGAINTKIMIIAIGRLVEFKTYNSYMLDVVKSLINKGYNIQFDIYGDGPLKEALQKKITQLGLTDSVNLKGTLDYLKFDKTVSQYDLFIGSGTAIVQASALGVPSVVGVENVIGAKTYGYFKDVHQYEYNLKGLDIPLVSVEDLIINFITSDNESRLNLKVEHLHCIESFTNESCQNSMDSLKHIAMPTDEFKYNRVLYVISHLFDKFNLRYNKNHPRLRQFDDFRVLDEK
ncbi:glycosyltransferase [Pseudoalteromonas nigrifaciens]|uniref:glycosyltransferase n=1 Tax=Pseudoalteromonas nigrifaciens TaxID=28109 RepID=UPI003FD483A7